MWIIFNAFVQFLSFIFVSYAIRLQNVGLDIIFSNKYKQLTKLTKENTKFKQAYVCKIHRNRRKCTV